MAAQVLVERFGKDKERGNDNRQWHTGRNSAAKHPWHQQQDKLTQYQKNKVKIILNQCHDDWAASRTGVSC